MPVPPTPVPTRPPVAGRIAVPRNQSGRRPSGVLPAPLDARVRFEKLANRMVVALVHPATGEVVKQIPPEEIVRFSIHLRRLVAEAFDSRA